MTRETQAIFKKALKLPLESKADLVELLLNSILEGDRSAQQEVDTAWGQGNARSIRGVFARQDPCLSDG